MIGWMSETSRSILGGLMEGRTQHSAAGVGISKSPVSRRFREHWPHVGLEIVESLGRLP
jgi:hypothetical protein